MTGPSAQKRWVVKTKRYSVTRLPGETPNLFQNGMNTGEGSSLEKLTNWTEIQFVNVFGEVRFIVSYSTGESM